MPVHFINPFPLAPAGVSITDTFTGTDGTSLNGRSTTTGGKVWAVTDGSTWEILNNEARWVSGGSSPAADGSGKIHLDAGVSDCTMQISVAHPGASKALGLVFRYVDANNYWTFFKYRTAGLVNGYFLRSVVAGALSYDSGFLTPGLAGPEGLKVVLSGSSIQAYGGLSATDLITSISNSTHSAGTRFGLFSNESSQRIDNLSLTG